MIETSKVCLVNRSSVSFGDNYAVILKKNPLLGETTSYPDLAKCSPTANSSLRSPFLLPQKFQLKQIPNDYYKYKL